MNNNLDNTFKDVRNAFRLLNVFQERIINIVYYIREQTPYTNMWGSRMWYFDEIGKGRSPESDYAHLKVYKDMWGWDFLYGYIFEYWFSYTMIGKKNIDMSIFQLPDDGWFISNQPRKDMDDITTFAPSAESHSYIILNVSITSNTNNEMWLDEEPNGNRTFETQKDFLTNFFSSSETTKIVKGKGDSVNILKKYEMQRFFDQSGTDSVIKDFGRLVEKETDVKLFKDTFYNSENN